MNVKEHTTKAQVRAFWRAYRNASTHRLIALMRRQAG